MPAYEKALHHNTGAQNGKKSDAQRSSQEALAFLQGCMQLTVFHSVIVVQKKQSLN